MPPIGESLQREQRMAMHLLQRLQGVRAIGQMNGRWRNIVGIQLIQILDEIRPKTCSCIAPHRRHNLRRNSTRIDARSPYTR